MRCEWLQGQLQQLLLPAPPWLAQCCWQRWLRCWWGRPPQTSLAPLAPLGSPQRSLGWACCCCLTAGQPGQQQQLG